MNLVNEYVNKIYKHANQNHPQTIELKEETCIHLQESVRELMLKGYSENEAFYIAIERFGGYEQAEKLIAIMEIRQRKFAKWLLRIGLTILVVVSTIFISLIQLGSTHDTRFAEIGYRLGEDPLLKAPINSQLKEFFILKASIYKEFEYSDLTKTDIIIEPEKPWIPSIFKNELNYGTNKTLVILEIIDVRMIGKFLLCIGLTVYYVLFSIWAIIQLYDKGELKSIWILAILSLNFIGYFLYLILSRKTLNFEVARNFENQI